MSLCLESSLVGDATLELDSNVLSTDLLSLQYAEYQVQYSGLNCSLGSYHLIIMLLCLHLTFNDEYLECFQYSSPVDMNGWQALDWISVSSNSSGVTRPSRLFYKSCGEGNALKF